MEIVIYLLIIILSLIFIIKRLGILEYKFNINMFFFFTNLSIILSMIYYIFILIFNLKKINEITYLLEGKQIIVLYMSIVAIIYNILLAPNGKKENANYDFYSIYDIIAHCILPILIAIDYILLTRHYIINLNVVFISLIFPVIYCPFVYIKAIKKIGEKFKHSNNHYPYFFFDVEKYGIKKVLINILFLTIMFFILAYLLYLINNLFLI